MTLQEFLAEENERLKRFEAMWKEGTKLQPQAFPMEMSEGDWDEQLRLFDE